MELVADFAYPLPVMVIGEMLGILAHDRTLLRDWIHDILMFAQRGPTGDPETITAMHRAIVEMRDYMRGIVADHRRTPQDDIIGNLLAAEEEGARLDEEEIIANCLLLLLAGHETTMNLLGNGTLALLQHPEQCTQLQANPDLLPNAVEEVLRYESPLQIVLRLTQADLELHGQSISAGQRIIPMIGAANRDPAQFPDPDRLDLRRTPNAHLSFGHGIHFCLGAGLARMEARIAFATLLQRCPGLALATDTPAWREALTVRGLATLPVTFAAGEPRRQQLAVGMSMQSVATDDAAGCPFH
jgi:cytochrome P450